MSVKVGQLWRETTGNIPVFYRVAEVPENTRRKITCRASFCESADQFHVKVRRGAFKDGMLILLKDVP